MIDSGVNSSHPDLAGKVNAGWSFLTGTSNTADVLGHGTATAGTAGAATNNGVGVAGVGWQNPIVPLVVLDSTDYASYSNIASAITWAADHGIRIINISIGGASSSSVLQSAVNYAWSKGSVIFAAAMNNSTSSPYYPAACQYVVAVSATESNDTLSGFSNYGTWISLSAPGDYITTTDNNGGYSTWYGTSFASPIAAATGALALSINPALSAQGLVNLLEANSDDLGAPGFDTSFGYGRVNAYKVAAAALAGKSSDTSAPTVSILSPSAGASVSGTVTISGTAVDNVGVTGVTLWVDGQLNSTCSSLSFSCAWATSAYASGTHTITVQASDAAGNTGSASETLSLAVVAAPADTQAPSVKILSPTSGSTVNGNVQVAASATDNVGVTQVAIYLDGTLQASFRSAPYNWVWNAKKSGSGKHTITAKAWDAAGNTSSASVVVTAR
jgi:hypothetical protein